MPRGSHGPQGVHFLRDVENAALASGSPSHFAPRPNSWTTQRMLRPARKRVGKETFHSRLRVLAQRYPEHDDAYSEECVANLRQKGIVLF